MRHQNFPYEYFNGVGRDGVDSPDYKDRNFVKTFLVDGNSFLTDEENVFDLSKIQGLKSKFETYHQAKDSAYTNIENDISIVADLKKKAKAEKRDQLLKQMGLSKEESVILAHAIWLWTYPIDIDFDNAIKQYGIMSYESAPTVKTAIAKSGGIAMTKQNEISFILDWFEDIAKKEITITESDVSSDFVEKYKNQTTKGFTRNLILHLFEPEKFEAIGLQDDKVRISNFYNGQEEKLDDNIQSFRKYLIEMDPSFSTNTFYERGLESIWKESDSDLKDEIKKLRYKRSIMFYGPPGTGKTHDAIELANALIGVAYRNKIQQNPKEKDSLLKKFLGKNIFRVQFHVNYTYEDFVAGMIIKDGNSIVREGFIYDVIKRADEVGEDLPVVVILDEVNRTDISRVFGELFSAIEYRGDEIDLSLKYEDTAHDSTTESVTKNYKLRVPKNIFFIGTMNEIDFSLERVDFALRRRFVWIEKTFDKKKLNKILDSRNADVDDKFIAKCESINNVVKETLGEKYLIGHSFFAEIANIMNEVENDYEKAKQMLWEISIRPTLEAYCGSMAEDSKNELIKKCALAFAVSDSTISLAS